MGVKGKEARDVPFIGKSPTLVCPPAHPPKTPEHIQDEYRIFFCQCNNRRVKLSHQRMNGRDCV